MLHFNVYYSLISGVLYCTGAYVVVHEHLTKASMQVFIILLTSRVRSVFLDKVLMELRDSLVTLINKMYVMCSCLFP
jgi:hypothetical protein